MIHGILSTGLTKKLHVCMKNQMQTVNVIAALTVHVVR